MYEQYVSYVQWRIYGMTGMACALGALKAGATES